MAKPIQSWKSKGIDIAAWTGKNGGFTFTIQKRYKDKQSGEWKTTGTYFPDDLTALAGLINEARVWAQDNGLEKTEPIDNRPASSEVKAVITSAFDDDDIPF